MFCSAGLASTKDRKLCSNVQDELPEQLQESFIPNRVFAAAVPV
jgi:hypothetical protein